ncbi:DUF421 domain-containing protein [uncultured Rubinisphaera sp.]|uniref:DUF421 domain-containing protein n=1 Tax=uncultured Rubinisphaera sp. TaxID=1678686 RepID=UPI0030DC7641
MKNPRPLDVGKVTIFVMHEILDQLHRIFLGDNSLWYLFEVAFRTSFIFTYTLMLLRFMGKRGMGQLTPFEFAIIVALGSAVGDPMFYDDVPLLHTMLVIAIVIALHRFLSLITQKNEAVEKFMEGETTMLINRGEILLDTLCSERLSRDELFEMLRIEGVSQLGEVRQAFLEPSGNLAVIRWEPSRPGLSIMPHDESRNYGEEQDPNIQCCDQCGAVKEDHSSKHQCGQNHQTCNWVTAVCK